MLKIFYSPKENAYFSNEEIKCTNCDSDINEYMLLVSFWDKKQSCVSTFCRHCFRQFKANRMVTEFKVVLLEQYPEDAYPVVIRPPELTNANLSVYQAADITFDNNAPEKVTDNTVYSGIESWEGSKIGNLDYIPDINPEATMLQAITQDDRIQYPDIQGIRFIESMKDAKPILPKELELKPTGR